MDDESTRFKNDQNWIIQHPAASYSHTWTQTWLYYSHVCRDTWVCGVTLLSPPDGSESNKHCRHTNGTIGLMFCYRCSLDYWLVALTRCNTSPSVATDCRSVIYMAVIGLISFVWTCFTRAWKQLPLGYMKKAPACRLKLDPFTAADEADRVGGNKETANCHEIW